MADKNVSPEERLFKVIQEGKDASLGDKNFRKKGKVRIDLRGIKQLFGSLDSVRKGFFVRAKSRTGTKESIAAMSIALPIRLNEISPRAINGVLIIMLSVLTVMTIHYGINKRPSIARISDAISKIHFQRPKREPIEAFRPVDFYLKEAGKRDIFRPVTKAQQKVVIPKPKQALEKLKETVKDLRLKGISWGATPKVMIKNEKEDKMYFLKQGQMIGATGIEVKMILKDKILISYEGEEMELL